VSTSENLNGGAYAKEGQGRHDGYENWRYKREGGAGDYVQPTGRFPANVILAHHPECVCVGEKKVKGVSEGNETVEDWQCHEDCPIRKLDEQSGVLKSGDGNKRRKPHQTNCMSGVLGLVDRKEISYGDTGGASRFFKNIQGE